MTVTPTGGTQQSVPDAIGGRLPADLNGRLSPSKLGFGAVNRLFNANQSLGLLGYSQYFNNTGIGSAAFSIRSKQYAATGEDAVQLYVPGTMPVDTIFVVKIDNVAPDGTISPYWPVQGTGLYDFSAGASLHRANGYVYINWINSSGNPFAQDVGSLVANNGSDGGAVSSFPRSRLLKTAPVGAVGAHLLLCLTGTGGSESYAFFSNLMFAQGFAGQLENSPYVDPGAKTLSGANLLNGSVPALALYAPTRGQFFRALENSSAGRVATVTDAVPSDRGDAINIAFNHTTFVTQAGALAQFVKTTLSLTDAQLAAIIASARTVAE